MSSFELNKSLERKLTILSYHGVVEAKEKGLINFQGKHILAKDFYEQMEFISKFCTPLSMNEWIDLRSNPEKIPLYPTIVTFDDGFKNNLDIAAPILEKFSVPSIFYISSGIVGSERMFWVDVIEQCLEYTKVMGISIRLGFLKKYKLDSLDKKIQALLEIKGWCKSQKDSEINRVVEELVVQTKISPKKDINSNYMTLSWDDLRALNDNDLFTIGGHTHTHAILSSLSDKELNYQISHCIKEISEQLDINVKHFSYPEGQEHHFNSEVIAVLKKENIICSPSAIYGYNDFSEDLFHLKRIMVGFDGAVFPHDGFI